MELIYSLLAVVNLACAATALYAARRSSALLSEARSLCAALSNERGRIAAHDAEIDQITDTLRKLSGRIGAVRRAARAAGEQLDDDEPAQLDAGRLSWKAAMREKYGLQPKAR